MGGLRGGAGQGAGLGPQEEAIRGSSGSASGVGGSLGEAGLPLPGAGGAPELHGHPEEPWFGCEDGG